jgi:glucokinase
VSRGEAIGVDLGGTKMLVGALDERAAVVHRRVAGSVGLSEEELLALLEAELREALESRPGVEAIGLGVPCTIDRARGACVSAANLPLRDQPLREIFSERLGLPVFVVNDATAAVIAEHRLGVARGPATW